MPMNMYLGRLGPLARAYEAADQVLQQLIRYVEEEDLEEIIKARWEWLQKEKAQYILQEEI